MRISIVRAALSALPVVAGAAAAQPSASSPYRLEQILSAPFPSNVTAARGDAGRAAWVSLERGARSVYIADLGAGRAARVAHFPVDDGQDLTSLTLSTDGRVVAFVRGQGYNNQRENPNPMSNPDGAEQAVWVASIGTSARRIGRGWSPVLSPDARRIVFQLDSTLYVAATTGAADPKPLFKGRGVNTDAQWSPDGRMVAFTSQRGSHAFVGVYDALRDTVRWMASAVDRDGSPRWSPDSKQVAFLRLPAGGGGGNVFAQGTGGPGFSIWLADAATGKGRPLTRFEPGPGGRPRVPTAGQSFLWVGRHIVLFTEADGWQHLYSVPAEAGTDSATRTPVQLTRGNCEVEEPSPTADGEWIYFSSNCEDIDRKHIWRVATAGGKAPEQITKGSSIEWAPAASGTRVLFLRSDARRPAVPVLTDRAGKEVAFAGAPSVPKSFPAEALVEPQAVTFKAADGMEIHGQLFVPKAAQGSSNGQGAPAVIFMHGGPPRQMLLGWHPRGYYNRAYGMNQFLASQGYVVLSVNYRGGVGYGRDFREAPRRGRQGASEYQDIVAAGRYLQTLPSVDSTRIGLWGGSYGGYLTAMGMVKNPELFKAGVDLHGVHDWNARFSNFAPSATTSSREADSVIAVGRASSPVCCVENVRGPMLLIHGDDDRNVNFSETVTLAQLLRRHNKPFELLVFPDEVHDFLRHANWLTAYRTSADFFDRTLKRGARVATQ